MIPYHSPELLEAREQHARARRLIAERETTAAIAALERAVELDPRESIYSRELAALLLGQRDVAAARRVLTEARGQMPRDASLALALARIEESTGDWQQAVNAYDVVLEQDPDDRSSLARRARCLYRLEDFARARQDFSLCTGRAGAGLPLADCILYGDACLRTGDFVTAQRLLDRVSAESPAPLHSVELLRAKCALRRGQPVEARRILDAASHHWPDDARIAELRARANADPPRETGPIISPRPLKTHASEEPSLSINPARSRTSPSSAPTVDDPFVLPATRPLVAAAKSALERDAAPPAPASDAEGWVPTRTPPDEVCWRPTRGVPIETGPIITPRR